MVREVNSVGFGIRASTRKKSVVGVQWKVGENMANSSSGNAGTTNDFPQWDDKDPKGSLLRWYGATVSQGEAAIDWYKRKQYWKRFGSRLFRYVAIGLVGIGAIL